MADATPPLTASDMVAMLRRHYVPENKPPAGVFAPEIQSPCGARRADLIWLSTTIAGGRYMVGHEVKVSRSDVISELRDPSKADPWAQFCDQWWLVVSDPALVDGLDIPAAWGIMAPPSGRRTRSMTVVRPAPKLNPSAAGDGVARVTAWLNQRYTDLANSHDREVEWRDRSIERLQGQLSELRDGAPRDMSPAMRRVHAITNRVEKEMRKERIWSAAPSDEEIVAALVDLSRLKSAVSQLGYAIRNAKVAVKSARNALDQCPDIDADDPLDFGGAA